MDIGKSKRLLFPRTYYDTATGSLWNDPVVDPRGATHERTSLLAPEEGNNIKYYPNRSLKTLIAKEIEFAAGLSSEVLEKSTNLRSWCYPPNGTFPDEFYCPITCDVMVEAVIAPDGTTFDRAAIVTWIAEHDGTSPITRETLRVPELRPNRALQALLPKTSMRSRSTSTTLGSNLDRRRRRKMCEMYFSACFMFFGFLLFIIFNALGGRRE